MEQVVVEALQLRDGHLLGGQDGGEVGLDADLAYGTLDRHLAFHRHLTLVVDGIDMGEDRIILGARLQAVDQVTVEVTVLAPCLLGVLGSDDILPLEHRHQEGDGVENATFDPRLLLDLIDIVEDVVGVRDLDVHGEP